MKKNAISNHILYSLMFNTYNQNSFAAEDSIPEDVALLETLYGSDVVFKIKLLLSLVVVKYVSSAKEASALDAYYENSA